MAKIDDIAADFEECCQRYKDYPLNLLRTEVFGHTQRSLQARLDQEGLFHSSHQALYVRDLQENAREFDKGRALRSVEEIERILDPEEKDPWWRFIFLHSKTSRDPLSCSKEQLAFLLTYHQVTPLFLDLVFTFKARQRPLTHALFRHENYLDEGVPPLRLPQLGRSGIQVQHAFNLLTVERSDMAGERNQWPLRHASLYHSLDLETGRAVYILLKGNGELAKRIKDATEKNRHLRGDAPRTREQSFIASLQIHLIMLEWSVESWSEYTDSMDDTLRSQGVEAKVAPVREVTSPVDLAESFHRRGSSFSKRVPQRSTLSRQGTFASRPGIATQNSQPDSLPEESQEAPSTPQTPVTPTRTSSRSLSGFLRRASGGLESRSTFVQKQEDIIEEPDALIERLEDLEERFSFGELQRLSLTGDEIDRSILALEQSKDVVVQVEEQYQTVVSSHAFKTLMDQEKCKTSTAIFFRRVRSILRELEAHRRRLLDLSRTVANDKQMFESLSQHTSIQTSKAFQLVAQTSSDEMMKWTHKMHEIAVKTKQETLSMHVITIFTLIFLPGTFIATFFSSGVLHWDEDGTLGTDYLVRGAGVRLFLSIALPTTVITIAAWAFMYGVARRWARKHARELGLPGYADEKALPSVPTLPPCTGLDPTRPPIRSSSALLSIRQGCGTIAACLRPMTRGVNPEPFRRFAEFVADIKPKHVGRDIAGNPKSYVPLTALRERQYLRIFSTLVYTGHDAVRNLQPLFISRKLTDENLPRRDRPNTWPDEKFFREFFKEIVGNQWQFFPLNFCPEDLQDLYVDDECILPIDSPVQIAHSNTTVVERFDIHAEFNDLERQPKKKTFVFKIYHNKRYEEYYENELRALRRLSVQSSENVVKFYGSFRQLGSYCLILEYADGGDLGEFFDNCPPPSTPEDVVLFWKSLFQVFSGLERIHQLISYNDDELIKGIHEDVRPENILLMKGPSGSRYDFTPKIADFGLYSRVRTAKARASGSIGLDNYGNQRFTQRHKGTNMITTSADIFSMGAVLSHTAAWVIGGVDEQRAYFRSRKTYHASKHPRFIDSGYEGCFHDSIEPLPIVQQCHCAFRERCKRLNDSVTPNILDWVEKFMLIRTPKDRLRARVILEKFEQLMDNRCEPKPPSPPDSPSLPSPITDPPTGGSEITTLSPLFSELAVSPSTIDGASPPPTTPSDASAQPVCRPPLQPHAQPRSAGSAEAQQEDSTTTLCDDIPTPRESQYLSPLQTQQPSASISTSASPSPVTTVGPKIDAIHKFHHDSGGQNADQATSELVEYLEHNLGGRDQFFFIDDSMSMRPDKDTISAGFRALACIAQRLDPDQVELAFASQPRKVYKAKRTKRLQKLVERCEYRGDGHMMESRMGDLIDNVIIPRLPYRRFGFNLNLLARKKVSVYIFTDGDWGDERHHGDACGVERPVKRLIDELKRRRLDRTQVSLHFVRFGDKENGRKHLEHLDNCGRGDMDVVDVKHIDTDIQGMIIGPITRGNDDRASEAS
ncbi:hypothetical protein B0T16DRAFT_427050 [Cercophora newfieldiana]|uniref:non-specific serine/threonine protein kinase n=1 Tax=Cercophora newfieldiana TaxID=92897 RepID=A0AA39YJH7_9PEZI|nr:hypothetical protein B0T16DRAFT_427050 [Cercophora newfieldiana]